MKAARFLSKRTALLCLVAVFAAAAVIVDAVAPAFAQEEERRYIERPRNIFEFLFGGPVRRAEPPAPPPRSRDRRRPRTREGAAASMPRAPAEPEVQVVEKLDNARPLLVIGDFLAGGLADALETVYAENANVRVVRQINGSSGFVRDDFYNWPAEIGPLMDEVKPAAVVVMMGSNDRQDMRVGDTREQRRSEKWTAEYERRVDSLIQAVRSRNVPLVWIGMPSFRQSGASADMLAFNDIYRQATTDAGGEFVDIWEGFVDESGAFVTTGPDVNGQPVRLRSGDNGVNMTEAGRRKVAFYAEKPLERIFGGAGGQTGETAGLPNAPGPIDPASAPAEVVRTEPISLSDPQIDGAAELLGATVGAATARPTATAANPAGVPKAENDKMTLGERLSVQGIAPEARPGRADDFGPREPAASLRPPSPETTTSIGGE